MTNSSKLFFALAVSALCSAPALAAMQATPEFESGETRPLSIAVLPVEATVVKDKAVDNENLIEEGIEYGALYASQIEALMSEKGYTVKIVDPEQINADPRLQELVVDANRRYDEMMSHVRPRRIKRRSYNAGEEARLLADYLGVDAVAFSRLHMTITPMGGAIVSALFSFGSAPGSNSSFAIVDGRTGDLEALFSSYDADMPGNKSEEELQARVVKVAEAALEELPAADPSARRTVDGDEKVLSEVESLLAE